MKGRFATSAVHAGEQGRKPFGAVTMPIVQSSTFTFRDSAEIQEFMEGKAAGERPERYEYGRYANPTQRAAEEKLAAFEGGEQALLFASGMNAITTTFLTILSSGDHLVMTRDCYHRTREFAVALMSRWGIETTLVDIGRPEEFANAIRPNTRLIFCETPTNPYLRVADLDKLVEIARQRNLTLVVDSTFATPLNLKPLEHGAGLVVQSATKYLGGHNDLLAGAVIGSAGALADIELARGLLGGVSSPHDAYLLVRGMKTLELRVKRQNENGLRVAQFLEDHPAVKQVYYPGLPSHPDYEVASKLLAGFGGVVSFEIDGDFAKTGRLIDALQIPHIGPTLGGVESIVEQPAALFSLDEEERRLAGIKDNLVRYALGIEDVDDLIADLQQALAHI
jgi:cystathionine gamma-synthase